MDLDSSDSSPEALAFNRWGEKKKRLSKSKPQKRPQKEDGRSAKRPKSEFKDTLVLPFTSLALGERCGYEDSDVLIPDTNSTDEWTKGLEFAGEDVCRDTPNEWELDKTECTTVPTASLGTHSNWSKTMVAQIGELQVGIRNIADFNRAKIDYSRSGSWKSQFATKSDVQSGRIVMVGHWFRTRGSGRGERSSKVLWVKDDVGGGTGILRLSVVTHSEEEKRAIDLVELNIIIKGICKLHFHMQV
ncbi:hypothetical protein DFS34DRAFT_595437 [Phlyctochytrium arcticum]|nr:hypothetical protein DFS34DRAFT_595437 [Phlyctochytrium arcticum]